MDNEYNKLRDELEHADLDSIVPGFDRNAAWQELSPRLKKGRDIYWLRYAAALVVLLIIGFVVRMQMDKEVATETNVAATKQAEIPDVNIQVKKTPAPPKPSMADTTIAVTKKKIREETASTVPTAYNDPAELTEHIVKQTPSATEEIIADTIVDPVVATQVKPLIKRPKAVHLLDIDNENRQAAMQNRNELQGITNRIVQWMPGVHQPISQGGERKPTSVFKSN